MILNFRVGLSVDSLDTCELSMRRDRTGYAKLVSDMCTPFAVYSNTYDILCADILSADSQFFFFHQILSRCGYGYRMEWKLERNTENTDRFIGEAYIVVVRKSIKANIWTKCFILRWTRCSRAPHAPCTIYAAIILLLDDSIVYILHVDSHLLPSSLRKQG